MISWTFCRPSYRSSMSGGKVETNERPGTASQTRPSCSTQGLWLSTRSQKSYLGPKATVPIRHFWALNLWTTSPSPFSARLRRFFELLQHRGQETCRQFDPLRRKNSSVYRLSKPPRCCFVVGPVKKHTVTTPLPPSGRWWESALYPDYYSVKRILQTTNPMKGLGCRPGCGQRMDLSMLGARYRDP